jgi:3-deoxy-D-manno-octulosonic-acid transferase
LIRSYRSPRYNKRIKERYGLHNFNSQGGIWIHAVSVGETIAAVPLVKALQNHYPQTTITITTMTPTGSEQVAQHFSDSVQHCYIPYDLPCSMKRFIRRLKPELVIVMETELWPNMVYQLHCKNIPILLANARLSERSQQGYQKILSLVKPMLNQLSAVAAQYQADGDRFLNLGLQKDKLHITGSIKFDITVTKQIYTQIQHLKSLWSDKRPIWIAASTHKGEDELLLEAHQQILSQYPDSLLILVPRHPERFDQVADLIQQANLRFIRKTELTYLDASISVLLGDTMGELMSLFGTANVAFVGGSLVKHGGHNPLEPAAFALPVIMGPHTFNFASVCNKLSDAGALVTVDSTQTLASTVIHWFSNVKDARKTGEQALNVLKLNQGALEHHINLIHHLYKSQHS